MRENNQICFSFPFFFMLRFPSIIHIDMRSTNKGEWSTPSSALWKCSKRYPARGFESLATY
uniref:Uncharacterized protein n=1 Tax=Utricularia reniformis TaxID=192314 RepID=A0A1Y0AZ71_9LAMI|nr:hypothetical protein AEK19_MT2102 [Utricularia reniformis]ART30431.1 hypothetical protein AEK19_MT2102 [Utricularia reniformis]